MKKTNLNLASLRSSLNKVFDAASGRLTFIAIIAVLLVYVGVVWKISGLAIADPPADTAPPPGTQIPKIDKKSIEQITQLEESNSEVKALFNEARNNPFQE